MTVSGINDRITTQKGIESVDSITSRSAAGMGMPMGIPMGIAFGVGMGIEIPSPRQPWTLPWVWESPSGSPWVWLWGGYGDGNSVPTAALITSLDRYVVINNRLTAPDHISYVLMFINENDDDDDNDES